jgi:hypothetical protein
MDQKRCLKIRFCPSVLINYTQLKFALRVADSAAAARVADSEAIVFLGDSHTEHFLLEELF